MLFGLCVLVAQGIERLPPKQQVARSIRAEDVPLIPKVIIDPLGYT